MSALKYWVWLSTLSGVGAVTAANLLRHFGTPENVYLAKAEDYNEVDGVGKTEVSLLMDKHLATANKTLDSCVKIGCRIITLHDSEYPERLRNIYDPPIILYIRGNLPVIDDEPVISIVGTRYCTPYGLKATESISCRLARHGFVITTGLAKGIDSAAARGAMQGGGRVIGVIGSGLDIVYPAENKRLFESVAKTGAIISEYAPGVAAFSNHFPMRNRILSGISLGVTVIEAPKRSGALITAARALEQGRDVFALPGNIDARSCEGSNLLLREGAIPLLSFEDIINEYAGLYPDKIQPIENNNYEHQSRARTEQRSAEDSIDQVKKGIDNEHEVEYIDLGIILNKLSGDEKTVAETIGSARMETDEIIVGSGLPAPNVLTALTMLEINGVAVRENNMYKLIRN